jgi:hypothetical protein
VNASIRPAAAVSDTQRITYQAAPGEKAVIKGSESMSGWQQVEASTWRVTIPNAFFGDYNPYGELIKGAWFESKQAFHTGAVYANGHWLKEAAKKSAVVKSLASGEEGDAGSGADEHRVRLLRGPTVAAGGGRAGRQER